MKWCTESGIKMRKSMNYMSTGPFTPVTLPYVYIPNIGGFL